MACRKCSGDHFNFVSCEQHAARVSELKRRERAPERFNRPREGERDFGNVTHTYQAHGPNVVLIPRKSHPHYAERPHPHYVPPKDAA